MEIDFIQWRRMMYHFIMNPNASSGKGVKVWKTIKEILIKEKVSYEAHILGSAEETIELVQTLTGGGVNSDLQEIAATTEKVLEEDFLCHIVVLGGDGTLNAVLNGIVDFKHTVISCIRTGSGNDFARNTGVIRDVEKALYHLLYSPEKQCLDYGVVCYKSAEVQKSKRFIISSGVGYDADICEEVSRSTLKNRLNRIHLGKLVYLAIGIRQIFTRKITNAVIQIDEKEIVVPELFFVVGMIHEMEGGGVPFCPNADATDGKLDICLVQGMPKWKLLFAVMLVYVKKHDIFKKITSFRCQRMTVELGREQWFHMDGETPCMVQKLELQCHTGLQFCK